MEKNEKCVEDEGNIIEFNKIRFFLWEKIKLFAQKGDVSYGRKLYGCPRMYGYRTGYGIDFF